MITGAQIRAARKLLGWHRGQVAKARVVTGNTIGKAEGAFAGQPPTDEQLIEIQAVLEAAGVEFTNGDEPGVKLRKHYTMITGARAVVYDPPEAGLPFIGVVLGRDGEVLIARSAASNAEAEALLATVMAHFSESVTKLKASKARKAK